VHSAKIMRCRGKKLRFAPKKNILLFLLIHIITKIKTIRARSTGGVQRIAIIIFPSLHRGVRRT